MSGVKSGVATQLKALNKKILFTHCYGHALNLAVKDSCTKIESLREAFETTREICKLVKKSPQRETKLKSLRNTAENKAKTIHDFCPTRWTVRGETLASVLNNFNELMDLWEWSLSVVKDTEMKARISGVKAIMPKFSFFFGCSLGETILRQTDNLSKALQATEISAAEGQHLANLTIEALNNGRNDEQFEAFWSELQNKKETIGIEDSVLPRKRRVPAKLREGSDHNFPKTSKDMYRQIYFEVFDFVKTAIFDRFNQKDFVVYKSIEDLLLKSIRNENVDKEFEDVLTFYGDDFDHYELATQIKLLSPMAKESRIELNAFTIHDLIKVVKSFKTSKKKLINQVIILLKLLIVAPATNAVSERSFSSLKRLKTYMRSTTSDARLNHLMLLHVHKDRAENLNLNNVAKRFVNKKDIRKTAFGKI